MLKTQLTEKINRKERKVLRKERRAKWPWNIQNHNPPLRLRILRKNLCGLVFPL